MNTKGNNVLGVFGVLFIFMMIMYAGLASTSQGETWLDMALLLLLALVFFALIGRRGSLSLKM